MIEYLPDMIAGAILLVIGIAFRNWATTIRHSTDTILSKLELLSREFHQHNITTESRVTRVEEKVNQLESK